MTNGGGDRDTIFALASAPGRAGVAIVRLSGPSVRDAVQRLTRTSCPPPRAARLRRFCDTSGDVIDQGLVVFFEAPASYTGEDVAELHLHGGRAIVDGISRALRLAGLRAAEPGEFTRRAVENGKLDLTEAEAIADLVNAETEAQRRQAFAQYQGSLSQTYETWRERIVGCLAWAEAVIDFSDEDLPEDLLKRARAEIISVAGEIEHHLNDSRRGEILRDGLHLTVIGPPNAGKSSLVNALARRDVAIVAETPGTTRDVVEAHLDLGGYPVVVADTAGLRETTEAVEAEGVRRALARAEAADLVLLLLDGSDPNVSRETAQRADLVVWNKADRPWPVQREGICISLRTGEGVSGLVDAIAVQVRARLEGPRDDAPLTRARHRQALEEAVASLRRASAADLPELLAEDLRLAGRAIGRITGGVDIEEVLGVVFRDFCIGK